MSWMHNRWSSKHNADAMELWTRAIGGDAVALDTLYRQESGPVYRYALALCGNEGWAADALQEAFLALLRKPQGFDQARGSLGSYLCGIARHVLLASRRDQLHSAREINADDDIQTEDDWAPDPQDQLVRLQSLQSLHEALAALPWAQREALVLVDLQERDYTQAAAIAGVPVNTLRTRLLRGRRRLHDLLTVNPSQDGTAATPSRRIA
jgi:RNA polymerase sigma-70 factor (ECF subfamily)